jgi:hypothetical protein
LREIFTGFFYFDESIHPRGKFSLGAFVYCESSLDSEIADALRQSGLAPGKDEFKSGSRMDQAPEQADARQRLMKIVRENCGIGVIIAPVSPRTALGGEAFFGLNKILSTTQFRSSAHQVLFDQGIFRSCAAGQRASADFCFAQPCTFSYEQDSVQVMGLQLADLVAHTCSIMLLASLGLVHKKLREGENSGYDPNLQIELEFEMWASLRQNFFADPPPPYETWQSQLDWQVDVSARGLHVAASCDSAVREAATGRFGRMYLGCIH